VRIHCGYGPATGCPGTGGLVPDLVQCGNTNGGGAIHLQAANAPSGSIADLHHAQTTRMREVSCLDCLFDRRPSGGNSLG